VSFSFSQPSSGAFFKPAEYHGHLILVVRVTEVGTRYDNLAGKDKAYVVMDMVDLDSPQPQLQQGVNDNHPGIVNKLTNAHRTGEMVLGRIGQIPSEKGNPAWVLGPFQEGADDLRASQWLQANPINQFGQPAAPAPQAAPPAPVPVPQPVAPTPVPQPIAQAAAPYMTPAGPTHPVQQAYNAAQAPQAAPVPAPAPQSMPAAPPAPQPVIPAPAPAPVAPAAQPAQQLDPNNLPPDVAALVQQLGQQQ
jgi:hypothetical protein